MQINVYRQLDLPEEILPFFKEIDIVGLEILFCYLCTILFIKLCILIFAFLISGSLITDRSNAILLI